MDAKLICLFLLVFNCCGEGDLDWLDVGKNANLQHLQIIAHRGVASDCEENSLKAFVKAADIKADAVEFDVLLSSDGELMVFHDDSLSRMTGQNGRIQDYPKETLKTFKLKNQKGIISADGIPDLDEVLDSLDNRIHCHIEMKIASRLLERKLVNIIESRNIVRNVTISSFDYESLRRIHSLNPDIELEYLLWDTNRPPYVESQMNFDHIQRFGIHYGIVNKDILIKLKDCGKKVDIYTLNDYKKINEAFYPYIDGIITDETEYWLELKKK